VDPTNDQPAWLLHLHLHPLPNKQQPAASSKQQNGKPQRRFEFPFSADE
jgi:hypothetical protein